MKRTLSLDAKRRLAASEAHHRGVLANMGEGFTLFADDFTILEINEAATRMVGQPRHELVGRSHWDVFPGTFDAPIGVMYREVLASGRPGHLEHLRRFPDGRQVWFEVRAFPVAEGLGVFFRDVTARREADHEAALAAERVQLALDAGAIVATWVWSVPDDRLIADERFAASFDLDPARCAEGMPLQVVADSIHPEDRARVEAAVADALARGGAYRCEYRVRQRDGAYRWVEANGRAELDADGHPVRFPGVLLDIEDRRRTEAERDRVTTLLQGFIDAVPGVVYAKDLHGRLIVANRGTAELLGRAPADFIGRTDREVLGDAAQAEAVMATDRRIMVSGIAEQLEESIRLADGTDAIWWSTKAPMRDGDGNIVGLIGSSVEITDRKRAEEALRLSEQRAAIAMDVAQLGMWELDLRTRVVTADARCRRMCGLPDDGGMTLREVRRHVHPEDWERAEQALREMERLGDDVYAEEFRWAHADGRITWTAVRGVVQRDTAGEARTMLGSVLDVTERRQFIETLRQADRRKDEFLAMLAHELRNPLAPISTAAHLLRLTGDSASPGVAKASEIIGRQVGHLTRLVDDLLDVSRVTRGLVELDLVPLDLRAVVAAAAEQARPLIQNRGHELRMSLGADASTVDGDFHRLVQVVANLLNNAAKYTPPGGVIDVRLEADGDHAAIRVGDNGIGIEAGLLPLVFDLFTQAERTPDRAQGGLGIGLALVRSIVQLHRGEVEATSAGPNRGSVFTVRLPRLAGDTPYAEIEAATPASVAPRRVLVVDDNEDAAATLADVLRLIGHEVGVAHGARDALALATAEAAWDTYILDIGLPEMTGYELGRRLRALPGGDKATLVALTGYGQPHDRSIAKAAGFDHHLVKPADVARLAGILDRR